ncbi:hypothetical protein LTR37_002915 [Vermiconidia calcicola]|uniref:Uncharacterized protein n=1 Tax=Vermiconidia calcicola TaxID=1690605 RepID=A0ACC3NRR6_9PEZI|nr:hypothetical protein LTR37_002915 [Vermiconidia calcicola]
MPEEDTDRMSFFALYQTERKRCLESPEFKDHVRQETELWQPGLRGRDVGEFAIGEFTLVEVLGSYEYNEREEVAGKIQFEHVNAVSILQGYRRTLLYRPQDEQDQVSSVVLIHEFETLDSSNLPFVKQEMETIEPTKDCSFQLRSFELQDSEGFDGRCRTPERL